MPIKEIENILRWARYPEHLIPDWAQWLHENIQAERIELRLKIFAHFYGMMIDYRAGAKYESP